MKEHKEPGLVFMTNAKSRKCQDLLKDPRASLYFYSDTEKQRTIRIEGNALVGLSG